MQARLLDDATGKHVSIGTFSSIGDANAALVKAEAAQQRGEWIDPRKGTIVLADYAKDWLATRPKLRPRTRELYESGLRLHILPTLGNKPLAKITPAQVRSWYSTLGERNGVGPVTVAKVYRLLRTILNTAVEDRLITHTPCTIKGGGIEESPERPVPTVEEVLALANAMPFHLHAAVLIAAFGGLRIGEVLRLERRNVDLGKRHVTVEGQLQELADNSFHYEKPKSKAGYRTVALPPYVMEAIRKHLEAQPASGTESLVFRPWGCEGNTPIRRAVVQRAWTKARKECGLAHLHFHDLRHAGQVLAVGVPGVGHANVMQRMGHSTIDASQKYMHALDARDAAIADAIQVQIDKTITGTKATITHLLQAGDA